MDIERILALGHFAQRLDVVGVADCHAVGTFRIAVHELATPKFGFGQHLVLLDHVASSLSPVTHSHIHQIDGIVHVGTVLAFGIAYLELSESLDGKREVLQLFVDDDAFVVEPFLDEFVGCLFLFVSKRNLCQVILWLVWVVGILVLCCSFFVGRRCIFRSFGGKAVSRHSFGKLVGYISIV